MTKAGLCAGLVAGTVATTGHAQGVGRAGADPAALIVAPDFGDWLAGFRVRALAQGITRETLDAALAGLAPDPGVLKRDRSQAEFSRAIWDYLDSAVSEDRIAGGRAALDRHAGLFARIEARYGIEPAVVAAVWGLESAYGTFRGDMPVIRSLATLAADSRRSAFFEGELVAALRILQDGDTTPGQMTGSWAGAMGHTQFMPSSHRALAVDFDGDGRRDIWSDDPADALASAAAYLAHHGWIPGKPWGVEVALPEGFDYTLSGGAVVQPVADWQADGVRLASGAALPDHGPGALLLPAGARGPAFLTFANFQVIRRYNAADSYAIAIGHLSDRLRGGGALAAGWPRGDRVLSFAERQELQQRLTTAGFDTQGADGRIGPNTMAAIRAFQSARGLVADGYASADLLARLR